MVLAFLRALEADPTRLPAEIVEEERPFLVGLGIRPIQPATVSREKNQLASQACTPGYTL